MLDECVVDGVECGRSGVWEIWRCGCCGMCGISGVGYGRSDWWVGEGVWEEWSVGSVVCVEVGLGRGGICVEVVCRNGVGEV